MNHDYSTPAIFSNPGTYTYTISNDANGIGFFLVGADGGGGGAGGSEGRDYWPFNEDNHYGAGGGGGTGGCYYVYLDNTSGTYSGATVNITVGNMGGGGSSQTAKAGNYAKGDDGGNGSITEVSIGSPIIFHCALYGGKGGTYGSAQASDSSSPHDGDGGAGGTGQLLKDGVITSLSSSDIHSCNGTDGIGTKRSPSTPGGSYIYENKWYYSHFSKRFDSNPASITEGIRSAPIGGYCYWDGGMNAVAGRNGGSGNVAIVEYYSTVNVAYNNQWVWGKVFVRYNDSWVPARNIRVADNGEWKSTSDYPDSLSISQTYMTS